MWYFSDMSVRCLICSESFRLSAAPVVPIDTPASATATLSGQMAATRIRHLPLGFNRVCPKCR